MRAGAGFGKTTLLAQAVRRNAVRPSGLDLWLGCAPSDADGSRFAAALAGLVGDGEDLDELDDVALHVADTIAGRSPTAICLVLDDVHHLGPDSGGAAVLDRLLAEAPDNLHVVLSGRHEPAVALSRFRASGDLVELTEAELALDEAEEAELGVESASVGELGGWPALVRMSAALGRPAARRFLVEEVLHALDPEQQRVLAVSSVLGGVDAELHEAVTGERRDLDELVAGLPLVAVHDHVVIAHDLWSQEAWGFDDVVRSVADDGWRRGAAVLLERDEHERAIALGIRLELDDVVLTTIERAVAARLPVFPADTAERWAATIPARLLEAPEVVLLRAAARLDDRPTRTERLHGLHDGFADAGREESRLTALAVVGYHAYASGDLGTVLELRARLAELDELPGGLLGAIASGVDAVLADLSGDPVGAVEHLGRIDQSTVPDDLRLQFARLHANSLVLLGRPAEALDLVGDRLAAAADPHIRRTVLSLRYFAGDSGVLVDLADPGPMDLSLDPHNAVIHEAFGAHFRAALGMRPGLSDGAWDAAAGNDRLRTMVAVSEAVCRVVDGDEAAASEGLVRRLDELGDAPLVTGEILRFPAVVEVLAPDRLPDGEHGPTIRDARQVGAVLRAARAGTSGPVVGATPDADRIATAVPLRWSTELVARAHDLGADWARLVAADLADITGDPVPALLEEHAASEDASLAAGAEALLATVPLRPSTPVTVELLGDLRIRRGGEPIDDPLMRRQRVRQLVALLAMEGSMSRWRVLDLLWPDADQDKGLRNLRTNLSHVRRVLEPGLAARRAPYFIRAVGDRLEIGGSALTVDVWDFDRLVTAGATAEDEHRLDEAIASYVAAVELWRGEPFVDLADVDEVIVRRSELTSRLLVAATRAAELLVAKGDHVAAARMARRALEVDDLDEAAHRAAIAAAYYQGDRASLDLAVERLGGALAELRVDASPETAMLLELVAHRRAA